MASLYSHQQQCNLTSDYGLGLVDGWIIWIVVCVAYMCTVSRSTYSVNFHLTLTVYERKSLLTLLIDIFQTSLWGVGERHS